MKYRTLPKDGMKISTIGIGSGSVHESDEKQIVELVDCAQKHGVNLIDLALSYPQCSICEKRCPFGVSVRDKMRRASALLRG